MEEARFGGAHGDLLHLGDFREGEPLDEEELRGEPLVCRQRGEGLANGERFVRHGRDSGLLRVFAAVAPGGLGLADMIRAAPPQDAEGPWREPAGIAQGADPAQDRKPGLLHRAQRRLVIAEQPPRGTGESGLPAGRQSLAGAPVARLHQRDEQFVVEPSRWR